MARCVENQPQARAWQVLCRNKKAGEVRRKSMANLEYTIYNPITHHTIQDVDFVDLLLSYQLIASYSLIPLIQYTETWESALTIFTHCFFPMPFPQITSWSNPKILGWKPSSNSWDFERIVSEFNPCRLYMSICYNLRDIGRNSCWKKPPPSLVNDSLPVIFLLSKKNKLTHETDSQRKMRHCTFSTHSFVAHKLGANVNIIDLDGGADTKKMYQRLDPCTS